MATKHIEVWYDETSDSDEPLYCVSLCEADGEEIYCLSTHEDYDAAVAAGNAAAEKRGVYVLYRETTGQTRRL